MLTGAVYVSGYIRVCTSRGAASPQPRGDPALLEQAAALLARAERPLIFAGGGVLAAAAWEEWRALAEALEVPVILSRNGPGAQTFGDRRYVHCSRHLTAARRSGVRTADAARAATGAARSRRPGARGRQPACSALRRAPGTLVGAYIPPFHR